MPESSFEFPIRVYDRPAIALANLLSGNIDASTKAIFSPMSLTPEEIKNVRNAYMPAAKDNTLIKTALDVATNPIVIAGLILTMAPFGKIATPDQLHLMWAGGGKAMKGVMPFIRWVMSPLGSWRAINHRGVQPLMGKVVTNIATFRDKYISIFDELGEEFFKKTGTRLTPFQQQLVTFHNEGMHRVPAEVIKKNFRGGVEKLAVESMSKSPFQSQFINRFGKDVAVMANLEKVMNAESPELIPYANKVKEKIYQAIAAEMKASPAMTAEIEARGLQMYSDYIHRVTTQPGLSRLMKIPREKLLSAHRALQRSLSEGVPVGGMFKGRTMGSIPNIAETTEVRNTMLTKHGIDIFGKGQWDKYITLQSDMVKNAEAALWKIAIARKRITAKEVEKILTQYDKQGVLKRMGEIKLIGKRGVMTTLYEEGLMEKGYERLATALQEAQLLGPEAMRKTVANIAKQMGTPSEFLTRTDMIIPRYVHGVAPTAGWHSNDVTGVAAGTKELTGILRGEIGEKGVGKTLYDAVMGRNAFQSMYVHSSVSPAELQAIQNAAIEEVFPMIRGFKHLKEVSRNLFWKDQAYKFHQLLISDSPVVEMLPTSTRNWLIRSFSGARGGISEATMGGKLASLLYTSALGMNLSPVSKNLLQPFLTTLPLTGGKNLGKGMGYVARNLTKFPATMNRIAGMNPKFNRMQVAEEAFKQLFPEYSKVHPLEDIIKTMATGDIEKEGQLLNMAAGALKKGQQVLMTPFGASEKWNRLVSFYSGRFGGLASGLTDDAANALGEFVNMQANFTGGTTGLPGWARGTWAPFRQFGHFPSRYLEYLWGSMRMGPEGAFSTGVLGKSLVTSAAMYTVAKNLLKMDISGGLMTEAMPGPTYEGSAFYPAPYVPPILGAMGDVVKAFDTGDFSKLGSTAALLTPGGLAARRAWRTYHPKYADYRARTPDGRIPIYNDTHALIGAQTPMQIVMRGLGLHPIEPEAEKDMTRYLLAQRDKIRTYRRDFLEAIMNNNLEKSQKINADFQKEYPSLGPLYVKKSDIKAVETRKEITRMNRVLKGFPKEYQPLFREMMEQATLRQIGKDLDSSPSSLSLYLE